MKHISEPRPAAERAAGAVAALLETADVLLIVPPFHGLNRPSLGVHVLQGCADAAGIRASVLYANLCFATLVGERTYEAIGDSTSALYGERLFAPVAYGFRPTDDPAHPDLAALRPSAEAWADAVANVVAGLDVRVVGCTTMFQQTAASIALLTRVKRLRPDVATIIGGANCENEMGQGIARLCPVIDVVFSGESETTFVAVMQRLLAGERPASRVIYGQPCRDLDAIPTPRYTEFFDQLARLLPGSEAAASAVLPAESSRGCWWGQKHQCTFCGLNGLGIGFREKSPDRVIEELKTLVEGHPTRSVSMADNIMPYTYFRTLVPRLAREVPDLKIFYEQKANLSLDKVVALKRAGVTSIQPGIEALSTCLLRRMDKGVTGPQNVALLRYTRSVGMGVVWNLLCGFPGDHLDDYEETLRLLPLLRHLQPPTGASSVSIERFSPYFDRPEQYGISNIRPIEAYALAFPPGADLERLAYHFDADFASAARDHPDVIREIRREIDQWRRAWTGAGSQLPALSVRRLAGDVYVLHDTRGLPGTTELQVLARAEAAVALVGRPRPGSPELTWALDSRVIVELDGGYVPLATAEPELLLEFEAGARASEPVATRPPGRVAAGGSGRAPGARESVPSR
jgi:ribosomal peptide maturation radical SAM protein 1